MAYHADLKQQFADWRASIPEFQQAAERFLNGEINRNAFKGISGGFGVYAQRTMGQFMLRLRMPAGEVSRDKLEFLRNSIRREDVPWMHFTTCQSIQFHDLKLESLIAIMEDAADHGVPTRGGGGDFPRNTMCTPLTGVDPKEYFNVLPYAKAAGTYLLENMMEMHLPRKLKVGFSSVDANETHVTFRDLGFLARPDGRFDVYSAGGLGNNPKLGILIEEGVDPSLVLYYVRAMWEVFREHGNYQNRGRARSRYIPDTLGSEEAYREIFKKKVAELRQAEVCPLLDQAEEISLPQQKPRSGRRMKQIFAQKQPGYYAVSWHPVGGTPDKKDFLAVTDFILDETEHGELRVGPDETVYWINLSYEQAKKVVELTKSSEARTTFERSTCCVGAQICQQGIANSAGLLARCVSDLRRAGVRVESLPQIHFSGCPSSCGAHQSSVIGFRGTKKPVNGVPTEAFILSVFGDERRGKECFGREVGAIRTVDVPQYLIDVCQAVEEHNETFSGWVSAHPGELEKLAEPYLIQS
jgi:sulfite reductase (ferredoxin)